MDKNEARIIITWDREKGSADYELRGLSHVEAQRLLLIIAQVNHDQAMAELTGHHLHEEGKVDEH